MRPAIPLRYMIQPELAAALSGDEGSTWLDDIGVVEYEFESRPIGLDFGLSLVPLIDGMVEGIVLLNLPGFAVQLAASTDDAIRIELLLSDRGVTLTAAVPLSLRFQPPLFNRIDTSSYEIRADTAEGVRVPIGTPSLTLAVLTDAEGNVGIQFDLAYEVPESFSVPEPLMIGETGVVFELEGLTPSFSSGAPRPENAPEQWRGMFAERLAVRIPALFDGVIAARNFGVGNTGVYGSLALTSLELTYDETRTPRFEGTVAGTFLGLDGGLKEVRISLVDSIPSEFAVAGQLLLPFFDKPTEIAASLDTTGKFALALSSEDGLADLELNDILRLHIESFGVEVEDAKASFILAGKMTPLLLGDQGMQWPSLDIERLSIDTEGNVDFDGGWLDFPQQQTLNLGAFRITLSELGFGSEGAMRDGTAIQRQWLGVSGAINLLEGIPISASVHGLKVSWDPGVEGGDIELTMEGIGVSLEIPNTLRLAGQVRFEKLDNEDYEGDIVRGQITLDIIALRMSLSGELIIGSLRNKHTGSEFALAYVVLDLQFPTAIPLGATGAGLYGLLGLVGVNVAPDRHQSPENPEEQESWYAWYKEDRGENSARNVTKMQKWAPKEDHYAFGAGLTVGTVYDDGYTINVRALLAVLIPGPVIMIEGRANLLKSRGDGKGEQGAFYALAVFDGIAGTFQLNVDVLYEIESVVTVGGGVEAFFDFNDPARWHLWLGQKEPETKRIRAQILSLFQVSLYLMIDNNGLLTGAKAALDIRGEYGPLTVVLEIGLSFDAGIYWNPLYCEGRLEFLINIAIRLFGIGIGILIHLLLEAKAAAPFWVHGLARFKVELPFPLPSFDAQVEFTWEEPTLPEPVWPLLKSVVLTHPFAEDAAWLPTEDEHSHLRPIVPVDALAIAKFARPLVGRSYRMGDNGAIEPLGHDQIDDFTLSYFCESIVLNERRETGYEPVAKSPLSGPDEFTGLLPLDVGADALITGTDAQEPEWRLWKYDALPGASVYQREDAADQLTPCPAAPELQETCVDFGVLAAGIFFGPAFQLGGWNFRTRSHRPSIRLGRLEFDSALWVRFPKPVRRFTVRLSGQVAPILGFLDGVEVVTQETPQDRADSMYTVSFEAEQGVDTLLIEPAPWQLAVTRIPKLASICTVERDALEAVERLRADGDAAARQQDGGSQRRLLLRPNTDYRIDVVTRVKGGAEYSDPLTQSFYFRSGDGPGADQLSDATVAELADQLSAPEFEQMGPVQRAARLNFAAGKLNTIAPYIEQTQPAAEDDPFYFGLDVRVIFRNRFIEQMYSSGQRLDFRFTDLNGHAVPPDPAERRSAAWLQALFLLASPGLLTWEARRRAADCQDTTSRGPASGAPVLWINLADARLKGRRRYLAELVLEGGTSHVPLYDFSFVTSTYSTPSELLLSGIDASEDDSPRQVVRRFEVPTATVDDAVFADSVAQYRSLSTTRGALRSAVERSSLLESHDLLAECTESRQQFDQLANTAHRVVMTALGIAPTRERPPALEVFATRTTRGILIRLESPEPFAWTRWRLTLRYNDGETSRSLTLISLPNVDRTSALLVTESSGNAHFGPGDVELLLEYLSLDALDHPELSIGGATYQPEPVLLRFALGVA